MSSFPRPHQNCAKREQVSTSSTSCLMIFISLVVVLFLLKSTTIFSHIKEYGSKAYYFTLTFIPLANTFIQSDLHLSAKVCIPYKQNQERLIKLYLKSLHHVVIHYLLYRLFYMEHYIEEAEMKETVTEFRQRKLASSHIIVVTHH